MNEQDRLAMEQDNAPTLLPNTEFHVMVQVGPVLVSAAHVLGNGDIERLNKDVCNLNGTHMIEIGYAVEVMRKYPLIEKLTMPRCTVGRWEDKLIQDVQNLLVERRLGQRRKETV
jgi:hypothetical protein